MDCFIGNDIQGGITISISYGDIRVSEHKKGNLLSIREARLAADVLLSMVKILENQIGN